MRRIALRKACASCWASEGMYPKGAYSCTLGAWNDVHRTVVKTHIELDDGLLEEVFRMGRFSTKKAAVNAALAEYAKLLKRRELLQMQGKVPWSGDLDALRANRTDRRP